MFVGEGGGGADDKFVTLFVKKGYGLVSVRSQPYRTRPEAECDMAVVLFYKEDN